MKLICCSNYYMALVPGLHSKNSLYCTSHTTYTCCSSPFFFTNIRPHSMTKTFLNRGLPASRVSTAFATSRNAYFSIMHFTPCVKAN